MKKNCVIPQRLLQSRYPERSEGQKLFFSPRRFVGSEAVAEKEGIHFEENMKLLTEELAQQFEEGVELDRRTRGI